ncbi:thiamine phosphate phosphatase-like protein [Nymphaea colorata]|nr:thiamine phosphate phosphatase-like protein [Nymphaea colorata]
MAGVIVVFDFDKTIIDVDSDDWVIDGLGLTERFNELLHTMPWNCLMDKLLGELNEQGRTIEDIAACLKSIPLHPQIISAIKSAYSLGCDLRVVSDANMFYIETILKHHELFDYFSEINTNPSYVDDNGRLTIVPYHDFHTSVHGCALCPPNMCKGLIIDRIRDSTMKDSTAAKKFIYLGDGRGDYCPALKLDESDKVLPRKDYPLWNLIQKNPQLIRAEIHAWCNAAELEETLVQLIHANTSDSIAADCKSLSALPSHHEALVLHPLPVQQ